jgi:hypothetical protein
MLLLSLPNLPCTVNLLLLPLLWQPFVAAVLDRDGMTQ